MSKIVWNIVKIFFFIIYDVNKNIKNWNDCIIFCYKRNLKISFRNGPEHETTSLKLYCTDYWLYTAGFCNIDTRAKEQPWLAINDTRLISIKKVWWASAKKTKNYCNVFECLDDVKINKTGSFRFFLELEFEKNVKVHLITSVHIRQLYSSQFSFLMSSFWLPTIFHVLFREKFCRISPKFRIFSAGFWTFIWAI